jgi:threonine synthase
VPDTLECAICGAQYPFGPLLRGCNACRASGTVGPLLVQYSPAEISDAWEQANGITRRMWGYRSALPLATEAEPVSIGEGDTPLVAVTSPALATGHVYLKVESTNPTGSFKDRLNSVAVSMARWHGFKGITCSSTGNHGASLAAYASAAGMQCVILLPEEAPASAVREVRHYGGLPVVTKWDNRGRLLKWLVEEAGWAMSGRNFPREFGNPYGIEGYKTIAYEIVRQLGGQIPRTVITPLGGGDSIYGIWRGFLDLHRAGIIPSLPRLTGCQAAATASAYLAWSRGEQHVAPVELKMSVAVSLTDRQSGDHALWAVRESQGDIIALDDDQIRAAVRALGRLGVCVEPASAAAYAAALTRRDLSPPVVCVLTGTGTRWPQTFGDDDRPAQSVRDTKELAAVLEAWTARVS